MLTLGRHYVSPRLCPHVFLTFKKILKLSNGVVWVVEKNRNLDLVVV